MFVLFVLCVLLFMFVFVLRLLFVGITINCLLDSSGRL